MSALGQFAARLRRLPSVVGRLTAGRAAPALTELAQADFDAARSPDGTAWAPGKKGPVTLKKSGALEASLRYAAEGATVRGEVGTDYAQYQVHKRPVLPSGALPSAYAAALEDAATKTVREEL